MKTKFFVLIALLLTVGIAVGFLPSLTLQQRDEQYMVDRVPTKVADYRVVEGNDGPIVSYKMSPSTYKILNPYGIVAQVYERGNDRIDAVLIASSRSESFHDPRLCFTGQGYELPDQKVIQIPTQTRGTIPALFTNAKRDGQSKPTAFFYKGPDGFHAVSWDMRKSMLIRKLLGRRDGEGVFYRFIALTPSTSQEEFLKFIGEYMDEVGKSSQGFF